MSGGHWERGSGGGEKRVLNNQPIDLTQKNKQQQQVKGQNARVPERGTGSDV